MPLESRTYLCEWASRLSHPGVQVLVQDDHVVVLEDGMLIGWGLLRSTPGRPV